jgi:hypothetical protein
MYAHAVMIWTYAFPPLLPRSITLWACGVLEYDQKTGRWDKYDDPDGENEMVLFKDQPLIRGIRQHP